MKWLLTAAILLSVGAGQTGAQSRSRRGTRPAIPVIHTDGVPYTVGRFARPTYGPDYGYGWVGGGAPTWKGDLRRANEGVWGRDYEGAVFLRRVWPNWWHSPRRQGGTGAYLADGPKIAGHH